MWEREMLIVLLFRKPGGSFLGDPRNIKKMGIILKDVEIEGKKQGYERASKEYEEAFRIIEKEFNDTKDLIEQQRNSYNTQADKLINKLEQLERQKSELERQAASKVKEVSRRYHIPVGEVTEAFTAGTLITNRTVVGDALNLIYQLKEKQFREAEQRGYTEAKKLYEEKINKLKTELKCLKEKGNKDIQNLLSMINDIFDAISEEQMKIADLKILLNGE